MLLRCSLGLCLTASLGLTFDLPPSLAQPLNKGPITLQNSFKTALENAIRPARKTQGRTLQNLLSPSDRKLLAGRPAAAPRSCSIPLLRAPVENPERFKIRTFNPGNAVSDEMAKEPPAPACPESGDK